MFTGVTIKKNQYYDSAFLMGINNRLMKIPGIIQTAVLMGSDANKEVLINIGFENPEIKRATANDLVIAVNAENQTAVDAVLGHLDEWLTEVNSNKTTTEIHTLSEAISQSPNSNLVVISVPGEFAAHEAQKSLESGKNIFLFSDNVSVEDEVSLKRYARDHGLLVMGPDCGTSIIDGIGIGFANSVRVGNIGVIAAAGTGLQEFTSMVHNAGYGISHAIGTGGRDLSDAIGGITTLSAFKALERDPKTEVITIISKPAGMKTLANLIDMIRECKKPVIGCFLGVSQQIEGEGILFKRANLIDDAVRLAIECVHGKGSLPNNPIPNITIKPRWLPEQKYLRGVFAGGTFCYQSQQILKDAGVKVYSNGPIDKALGLDHPDQSKENTIVDMGDEYFMVGRPHPMIDGSQRALRILREAKDPQVSVLLLDFIMGYNSSMDPVGELAEAIIQAKNIVKNRGGELVVVASVCGTDRDLQDIGMQMKILEECGVVVFQSNAKATEYCIKLLKEVDHA